MMDAASGSGAPPGCFAATGLGKLYHSGTAEVHALRGVDLAIPQGEMLVLLGPSGSGKSTLLNILGGLDRPSSGRLWFGPQELTGLDDAGLTRFRRAHVGFIFQFYNLIPSLTALENVRLVTDIAAQPMDPAAAPARARAGHRADAGRGHGHLHHVHGPASLAHRNARCLLCPQ